MSKRRKVTFVNSCRFGLKHSEDIIDGEPIGYGGDAYIHTRGYIIQHYGWCVFLYGICDDIPPRAGWFPRLAEARRWGKMELKAMHATWKRMR